MQSACDLVIVVWGRFYLHTLIHLCLPSLLAPDNLPAWQGYNHHRLVIYSPRHEKKAIAQYLARTQIPSYIEVVFRPLEPYESSRYDTLNRCHQDAIAQVHGTERSICFLAPDNGYTNGTLAQVQKIAAQGYTGILNYSPILNAEGLLADLSAHAMDGTLCITSEQALQLAFAHMHYRTWSYFWMLDAVGQPSACLYFQDNHLVIRSYHWHPLWLAKPLLMERHHQPDETIDGRYLQGYEAQQDKLYLVQDYQFMTFSCHPTWFRPMPPLLKEVTLKQRATFDQADQKFGSMHKWFFEHPIVWPQIPTTLQTHLPPQPTETPAQVEALAQITAISRLADHQDYITLCQTWKKHAAHLKRWAAPDLLWLAWGYALFALSQCGEAEQLDSEKQIFIHYFKEYPQWLSAIH